MRERERERVREREREREREGGGGVDRCTAKEERGSDRHDDRVKIVNSNTRKLYHCVATGKNSFRLQKKTENRFNAHLF